METGWHHLWASGGAIIATCNNNIPFYSNCQQNLEKDQNLE